MADDAQDRVWDVLVIGTGVGGGTLGRALAEAGHSVLFVEKGRQGYRQEAQGLNAAIADPEARRLRGYWPKPMHARIDGRDTTFFAPLGAGPGGSSVFYAAALERPERHDLEDRPDMPHPTGGWPLGLEEFAPWYARAEALYHVSGSHDPLSGELRAPLAPPPPLSARENAVFSAMQSAGLHPYIGHLALRWRENCQMCLGRKCPRDCKMDGRSAGVLPALATGRARLLDDCEVTRLCGAGRAISHVEALHAGRAIRLRARRYVLAAGALRSPVVLLNSASADWPQGAGNSSGLVGRNLMFHLTEMFALFANGRQAGGGASKALALRDFYTDDRARLGMVQAMGIEASYGEIVHYLNGMFDRSALRRLPWLRHLTRVPAALAVRLFGRATIFAGILEDLPYPSNRVLVDPDDPEAIRIEYRIAPELRQRRRAFRRRIARGLRGLRCVFLNRQPELNFGHPSGTLRFGDDAATSVLDRDCRAHDLHNLFVADASFMPTSMGVNPSLTIAANALRVAELVSAELKQQGEREDG